MIEDAILDSIFNYWFYINIYSILLTKEGEILKEQTEKGSIRDAVKLGEQIGKLFQDYV